MVPSERNCEKRQDGTLVIAVWHLADPDQMGTVKKCTSDFPWIARELNDFDQPCR